MGGPLILCYAGRGGANSFAQKLANYLANKTGDVVTVIGSAEQVAVGYETFLGMKVGHGFANPVSGGWTSYTGKPGPQ